MHDICGFHPIAMPVLLHFPMFLQVEAEAGPAASIGARRHQHNPSIRGKPMLNLFPVNNFVVAGDNFAMLFKTRFPRQVHKCLGGGEAKLPHLPSRPYSMIFNGLF